MGRGFTTGIIIGVAVGAVCGLLAAPKTGHEIRTQIADTSRQAAGKIGKVATKVAGIAGEVEDRLKHAI